MMLKLIRWYLYINGYWYQIGKNGTFWIGGKGSFGLGVKNPVGIGTPAHLLSDELDILTKKEKL